MYIQYTWYEVCIHILGSIYKRVRSNRRQFIFLRSDACDKAFFLKRQTFHARHQRNTHTRTHPRPYNNNFLVLPVLWQICELEDGHKAFAFSTGMAALSAVTRLVRTGQEIILNNDSYGGTYRLLSKVYS